MDEGRKRVLAIVARILVARHLKTAEDLFDNRPSPRGPRPWSPLLSNGVSGLCGRLTTYFQAEMENDSGASLAGPCSPIRVTRLTRPAFYV
jgi:hypothetical protein